YRDRISEIRLGQIANANLLWMADVYRRPVNRRKSRRDLNGADYISGFHRPHADHHRSLEHPCRMTGNMGTVHGNVAALVNVPNRHSALEQSFFKREPGPEEKGKEIV